jgi:hypothetical protein
MKTKLSISEELLVQCIFLIRGKKVMLDFDLATLYSVETRVLKQQVRRNMERFPGKAVVHSLTITNTFGSVLMERIFTGKQLQIQLPNAYPGVYFLNIQSYSKLNTLKFIVL